MAAEYGVATHNAFALLGDDEDDDPQALIAHQAAGDPDAIGAKATERASGKQAPREGTIPFSVLLLYRLNAPTMLAWFG